MKQKRILAVLTEMYGNRVLSYRLRDELNKLSDFDVRFLYVNEDDYKTYLWKRTFSDALNAAIIVNAKFREQISYEYDYLIINGYEIAYGLTRQIKTHSTILALDAVPRLVHEFLIKTSKNPVIRTRSYISRVMTSVMVKKVFENIDFFLPYSKWCAQGLKSSFGIPSEKMCVTYCPADLKIWRPRFDKQSDRINLLFVGNDFYRKGGDALLRIFERRFAPQGVVMSVISNEVALDQDAMPAGVTLYKNIPHEQMTAVFQQADVFVFPTLKEYLGISAIEAAACGLPIIARDVGGLKEFVFDNHNGFLMPYESTEEQWVEKIQYLIDHPEERQRMGKRSRQIAEGMFGMEKFEKLVKEVLEKVMAKKVTSNK